MYLICLGDSAVIKSIVLMSIARERSTRTCGFNKGIIRNTLIMYE